MQLCSIFHVPIAIVSLVDTDRQWFKSAQGLGEVKETPRTTSFCAWTLLPKNPEVLIVQDAERDERCTPAPARTCPVSAVTVACILHLRPRLLHAEENRCKPLDTELLAACATLLGLPQDEMLRIPGICAAGSGITRW